MSSEILKCEKKCEKHSVGRYSLSLVKSASDKGITRQQACRKEYRYGC